MNVLPNGLIQGSDEDKANWWTCTVCSFRGPFVGVSSEGSRACLASCGGVTPNPDTCFPGERIRKPTPEVPIVSQNELDEQMRQFKAQLACTRFYDYTILVAIERARKFARGDMATRDAQGKLIVFGQTYTYERNGKTYRADACGLDLRTHGWVFVWDVGSGTYECLPANHLTAIEETT